LLILTLRFHRTRANVDLKDFEDENGTAAYLATKDREMNLLLTALYFVVELARRLANSTEPNTSLKDEIGKTLVLIRGVCVHC
jgi:hypothetical protein